MMTIEPFYPLIEATSFPSNAQIREGWANLWEGLVASFSANIDGQHDAALAKAEQRLRGLVSVLAWDAFNLWTIARGRQHDAMLRAAFRAGMDEGLAHQTDDELSADEKRELFWMRPHTQLDVVRRRTARGIEVAAANFNQLIEENEDAASAAEGVKAVYDAYYGAVEKAGWWTGYRMGQGVQRVACPSD